MTAGLGPAATARTVRPGDEGAARRVALHAARADRAAVEGRLQEAGLALSATSARIYSAEHEDDREEARERALRAYERTVAARADLAIITAAVERLGGAR